MILSQLILLLLSRCSGFVLTVCIQKRHTAPLCKKLNEDSVEKEETTQPKHRDIIAKDKPRQGFFMATRALRGEYDPAEPEIDHERSASILLPAILQNGFPTRYPFTAVGKIEKFDSANDFANHLLSVVATECGDQVQILDIAPRLGGKYASVRIECLVQSPTMVQRVIDILKAQEYVKMSF